MRTFEYKLVIDDNTYILDPTPVFPDDMDLNSIRDCMKILMKQLDDIIIKHHSLSQKTKASEPDRRAHRMISPTKEFLKNHPCCGCIDWVEEKQECVADPLPGNVNTCFKAKEALYK